MSRSATAGLPVTATSEAASVYLGYHFCCLSDEPRTGMQWTTPLGQRKKIAILLEISKKKSVLLFDFAIILVLQQFTAFQLRITCVANFLLSC